MIERYRTTKYSGSKGKYEVRRDHVELDVVPLTSISRRWLQKRITDQAEEEQRVRTVTSNNFNPFPMADDPQIDRVTILHPDERFGVKPLAYIDNHGRNPLLFINDGDQHTEALMEKADEMRHYHQDEIEGDPTTERDYVNMYGDEMKRRELKNKGKHYYADTKGRF